MSRLTWFVFALVVFAGLMATCVNRNAHSELRPFLGKWNGGFVVTAIGDIKDSKVCKRNNLNGFVVLYATNDKFDLEISGEQQDITVTGTWKIVKPTRVELQTTNVHIDDFGGELKRDPNKVYIPNDVVTTAFSKPFVLDLSADKQHLIGLLTTLGDLTGNHQFDRVGSGG